MNFFITFAVILYTIYALSSLMAKKEVSRTYYIMIEICLLSSYIINN
jgi:hypothetical protein